MLYRKRLSAGADHPLRRLPFPGTTLVREFRSTEDRTISPIVRMTGVGSPIRLRRPASMVLTSPFSIDILICIFPLPLPHFPGYETRSRGNAGGVGGLTLA